MEDIYLKGFTKRDWCSDEIYLKEYFEGYSNELSTINQKVERKTKSEIKFLQLFVPQAKLLSQGELLSLKKACDGANLTTFDEDDLHKLLSGKDGPTIINKNQEECLEVNKEKPSTSKYQTNRIKPEKKKNTISRKIGLDAAGGSGVRSLVPRVDFKVLFRIHEPYKYIRGDNTPPGRCMQEIAMLGRQPLTQLRDSIICEADFQDVNGDVSENPDTQPIEMKAGDCYFSNMFYFDNSFYVDKRHEDNLDYSEPIRTWGLNRGIKLGESVSMKSVTVADLKIRFGYPYLYMHQGCCEHVVCRPISDAASLLTLKDNLCSQDYPLPTMVSSHVSTVKCMMCFRMPAKWIVTDCERLYNNPSYECTKCFKSFHYINGAKVGQFKAFNYVQRGLLL